MNIFIIIYTLILLIITLLSLWFLRYCNFLMKSKKEDSGINTDRNYKPSVSIIIPTYNEEILIEKKIKNTFELMYPEAKKEIIIVDSASTDNTIKVVKSFTNVILLTQEERKGKAHALSEAFKHAKGELFLITDADAMLNSDVLEKTTPYFADSSLGAGTGRLLLVGKDSASRSSESTYRTFFDKLRIMESRISSTMILNGPLMIFRSSIIEAPSMHSVADDTEMALQIIEKGFRAVYIPEATFFERVPEKNNIRLKQKERRAEGIVQAFIKHRNMLYNDKYGLFGMKIFPAEFVIHVIFPFILFLTILFLALSLIFMPLPTLAITAIALIIVTIDASNVYRKFENNGSEGRKSNILEIIYSFLQLQYALFKGTLKLLFSGSNYKWEQIREVRVEGAGK